MHNESKPAGRGFLALVRGHLDATKYGGSGMKAPGVVSGTSSISFWVREGLSEGAVLFDAFCHKGLSS